MWERPSDRAASSSRFLVHVRPSVRPST
jgi:hypothetical protein